MPPPSTLPKEAITVRFAPSTLVEESYQLLELPPDILKAAESGQIVPLTIKGRPHDDAVLCTANRTYTLRTVEVSNSLLILRPPASTSASSTLHIRDVCHQVLECVPSAGRVERLRSVLRDSAWGGIGSASTHGLGKRKRADVKDAKRYTHQQLQSIIQASDAELESALRAVNAVEVGGYMLLLPPAPLAELINVILKLVTVYGGVSVNQNRKGKGKAESEEEADAPRPSCPAADIFSGLADHDVDGDITAAVMRLFGTVDDEMWSADVRSLVRELGRGLLVGLKNPTAVDMFLTSWAEAAGEDWAALIDLCALSGEYLLDDPPPTAFATPCKLIRHFPVYTLPMHVATRFTDLFLTRARWRPDDMAPFLAGLFPEGDGKARDKLVAKYVRVVKEKDGSWWYPRRTG